MKSAPDPALATSIVEPILDWYDDNARDLPWRGPDASAWSVLVSEFMLQQTPVVRVEPIWRDSPDPLVLPKVNIGLSSKVPSVSNAGPGRIVTYGTGTRNAVSAMAGLYGGA